MIGASDFKKGVRILIGKDPYVILETQTQTPSARGAATLIKVKVRNLRTDQVLDKSFKTGEKFPEPDIQKKSIQFLYDDGDGMVFMDQATFEQFSIQKETLGDQACYITDALELKALFFEGKLLDPELPPTVKFKVVEVEPGTKGDTVAGPATKGAVLSNGLKIQVPLFVQTGDIIRISTKDGKFSERI